jgi:hypothetical protein
LVTAVAVDPELVDRIVEALHRAGMRTADVRCAVTQLRLQSPRLYRDENEQRQRVLLVGAVLGLALWLAVPLVHVRRLQIADGAAWQELARLSGPTEALRSARQAMQLAAAQLDSVDQGRRRTRQLTRRLAQLATSLPDSAYLATAVLDAAGNGNVTGLARPASGFVASLERAGWPTHVLLDGEPAPSEPSGWERFTLLLGKGRTR